MAIAHRWSNGGHVHPGRCRRRDADQRAGVLHRWTRHQRRTADQRADGAGGQRQRRPDRRAHDHRHGHRGSDAHREHRAASPTPTGWVRSATSGCATACAIAGATAGTYTLGDADTGTLIQVRVSYTDGHGDPREPDQRQRRAGGQRERCAHGGGHHHRHGYRRPDPERGHQHPCRCRRTGRLDLSVGALQRRRRNLGEHRRGHGGQLHAGRCRRGQSHPGQRGLRRCSRQPRGPDQRQRRPGRQRERRAGAHCQQPEHRTGRNADPVGGQPGRQRRGQCGRHADLHGEQRGQRALRAQWRAWHGDHQLHAGRCGRRAGGVCARRQRACAQLRSDRERRCAGGRTAVGGGELYAQRRGDCPAAAACAADRAAHPGGGRASNRKRGCSRVAARSPGGCGRSGSPRRCTRRGGSILPRRSSTSSRCTGSACSG